MREDTVQCSAFFKKSYTMFVGAMFMRRALRFLESGGTYDKISAWDKGAMVPTGG